MFLPHSVTDLAIEMECVQYDKGQGSRNDNRLCSRTVAGQEEVALGLVCSFLALIGWRFLRSVDTVPTESDAGGSKVRKCRR